MEKDKSFKKADYPNRRPFYADKHPQYRAYNKLEGFPNRESALFAARHLRRQGAEVLVKKDDVTKELIVYWRSKKRK